MFLRAPGCENACIDDQRVKSKILRPWLHLRSFERLIVDTGPDGNNDENETCESATVENYSKTSVFDVLQKKYPRYSFPSFLATNSLTASVDTTLTNIFATPLIPGPASSYSAIYTALMRSQHITTWSCGQSSKVVIS